MNEVRVLQWYLDSYDSPFEFGKMDDKEKIELVTDTLRYAISVILCQRLKMSIMDDKIAKMSSLINSLPRKKIKV